MSLAVSLVPKMRLWAGVRETQPCEEAAPGRGARQDTWSLCLGRCRRQPVRREKLELVLSNLQADVLELLLEFVYTGS